MDDGAPRMAYTACSGKLLDNTYRAIVRPREGFCGYFIGSSIRYTEPSFTINLQSYNTFFIDDKYQLRVF